MGVVMSFLIPLSSISWLWPKSCLSNYFDGADDKKTLKRNPALLSQRGPCDLQIVRKYAIFPLFFFQPQTCSAKGTEQPCEKNLSLWPGKLGSRVSVIHKGWGELSCFFLFSLFLLHFKQGQPQLRGSCTMQKSKRICVFLIIVTGKRPLETEEYGGNHGDENNWKRQPHSGYEVIQITTCVCWK